jgi:hypothetical protein
MGTLRELVEIISVKPLLTRHDLARRYGARLQTVSTWYRNGTLPPPKFLPGSRTPLWSPAAILANERRTPKLFKRANKK